MDDGYLSEISLKKDEIPDGQGYGIRKKYNFASITKKEIYEVIRNIAESFDYDETLIRNRMQELGIEPRNLFESDIITAIGRGNRNNGVGTPAGRGRGDKAFQNGGGADSRGYQGEIFRKAEEGLEENDKYEIIVMSLLISIQIEAEDFASFHGAQFPAKCYVDRF